MEYHYDRILQPSNKKEWTIDKYNMGESQNNYHEWEKNAKMIEKSFQMTV